MDSAQFYQKLLTEAIRKQIIILGPQITLVKTRNIPGLIVSEDGSVVSLGEKPIDTVTRFLEQFRELSAPLVKKTMQPLLSTLGSGNIIQNQTQPHPITQPKPLQTENTNQGLVPKT
jgi:hypothetical protein